MNKMNLTFALLFPLAFAFALVGCTVDVGVVPSRPPQIPATVQTAMETSEFGTINFQDDLDMDGISFFLWPENLAGKELEERVFEVNRSSMAIDEEFATLRKGVRQQEAMFRVRSCEKYSTTPGVTVRDEIAWRELDANTSDEDKIQFEECKASKATYSDMTTNGYAKIAALKENILLKVGPENWRDVSKKNSSLSILPSRDQAQVTLTLRLGKIVYSTLTEKASGKPAQLITGSEYIVPRRLLRFQMNELDEKRQPTGSVYHFELERAGDFLTAAYEPIARFTGDVRLVNGEGKVVRNGSFQINGAMEAPSIMSPVESPDSL
jgi:hypothetical protein